jgi:hypothetical protein
MSHGDGMTRSLASILTALVAAAALVVAAAPASASVDNQSVTKLRFPPSSNHSKQNLVVNFNGLYRWVTYDYAFGHPQAHPKNRHVDLHGRYRIVDTLIAGRKFYRHNAYLINVKTGGKVSQTHLMGHRRGSANYRWGSFVSFIRR